MLKNILKLDGAQELSKNELQTIIGGSGSLCSIKGSTYRPNLNMQQCALQGGTWCDGCHIPN